ncbi:hypothetical protein BofuT4_uP084220.1 [Botrytis cinerea T4]|uniref:Uncharacterized protein n=1 Tax=Botryotinia fuckeliana (strain T4) TaxID=999810 RepID=G2YJI1_BOTF4|nr:hypothetical protein BofuT4_uP084220.1 [Botrytis cinerea T4]
MPAVPAPKANLTKWYLGHFVFHGRQHAKHTLYWIIGIR